MSSARTVMNLEDVMNEEQRTSECETFNPLGDASDSSSPPPTSISSHTQTTNTSNTTPPSTPPRGRSASRYPSSLGRVPLHRRGTSKTYERLEDLLREAGYKETRVFTPEAERLESECANRERGASGTVRGGVGAVVGFIAGLVSRNTSLAREAISPPSQARDAQDWSPPPSPLSPLHNGRHLNIHSPAALSMYSYNTSTESLQRYSRGSRSNLTLTVHPPVPSRPTTPSRLGPHSQHSPRGLPHHSQSHLRQHLRTHSSSSNYLLPDTSLRPSRAGAYLRHMASAPNINPSSKRHLSTNYRKGQKDTGRLSRKTVVLNASDIDEIQERGDSHKSHHHSEHQDQMEPPMPRNWLENVARSILFGGAGAHIGGPDTNASHDLTMRSPARNAGAALSDHTNLPKLVGEGASAKVKAPFLCAQVDRRGRTSEGKVSCTMVMCRSAPASRAGSRSRNGDHGSPGSRRVIKGSTRGKLPSRSVKVKGKKREADGVPSLARTKAENDEWSPRTRHLSGWGIDTEQSNDKQAASSDENDDDDDDDDGELNLERLLVPARRQHSIRSLRKHLQKSNGATGSLLGLTRKKSMQTRWTAGDTTDGGEDEEWRNRSWGTGRGRRWIVGEDDDEGDGYGYGVDGFSSSDTGTGARAGIKRRRGIPWAQ